jgi:inhibitor of cysteine peptidase
MPSGDFVVRGCAITAESCQQTVLPSRPARKIVKKPTQLLQKADSGGTLAIVVGEDFKISLQERPTTGYIWTPNQLQGKIVGFIESDYSNGDSNIPGAAIRHIFTFRAKKMGTATISLKHWREFEGNQSVVDLFTITVTVVKPD